MSDDILLALLQPIVSRVRTDVSAVKERGTGMWRSDDALTRARLLRHLSGAQVRGAYLIKPGESVVRCAVLDLDDHAKVWPWERVAAVAARLIRAAATIGLRANAWSSSSGHGVHLWFLWDEPQDARSVRAALDGVLRSCMLGSGAGGLDADEVEIFPKQDYVPEGGYGNQVWLPLGGISRPLEPDLIDGTLRPAPLEWLVNVWDVGGWDWIVSEPVPELPAVERPAHVPVVLDESAMEEKVVEIRAMLSAVQDYSYDTWLKIGFALHEGTAGRDEGLALWDEWSSRGAAYEAGACAAKWESMGKGGEGRNTVGLGTLRHLAVAGGWTPVVEFEDVSGLAATGVGKDPIVQDQPRYERDKEGRILPVIGNILLTLPRRDLIGCELAFDTFLDELLIARRPGQWEPFQDVDYNKLRDALENRGKGFKPLNKGDLRDCVAHVAMDHQFDSAQIWLKSLVWDGVPRVTKFLETYWGTQSGPYYDAVGEYMWTALAGRVMSPGCQADMMPILVGDEGAGKSSTISALVPDPNQTCEVAFTDKDDDVARKLRGVLAVEVAELRGLGTRDEESIYAFVTRRYEKWVPKFKEFRTTFPRRAILFGTVNDATFLGKEGRRWLPFNVGARAGRSDKDVRPDLVARDREQLWAEGRTMWHARGVLYQEAERLAPPIRASFILTHPWEDRIRTWLADYEGVVGDTDFIPNDKLFTQALGLTGRYTGADGRQLAKAMNRLGYDMSAAGHIRGYARRKT